jgi:O-antigen ligase
VAFAGAYRWTTVPLGAGVLLLLALARPAIGRGPAWLLDAALLLCLLVVAAQMIPLQAALRDRLSPHAIDVERAVALVPEPDAPPPHPLSVDPESTGWAVALGAAYVAVFWCARAIFSSGAVRSTIRGIASMGLALTALVVVQRATAPTLLYWTWTPLSAGAQPYGPFVNRNSLASWLAMSVPLVVGYVMARYRSGAHGDGDHRPGDAIDPTQLWLGGCAVLMTGGLLMSMSRAGILGGAVGLAGFVVLSRRRVRGSGAVWMVGGLLAMVVLASAYGNLAGLARRMQATTEQGEWGRPVIWRDTWRMASDFRLTGVGAGAFQRGMLLYQQGSRLFFFNHAHDEYLQLLAEGGLALVIPAAIAVLAAIALSARQLRGDRTAMFWVRLGAVSGMIAVVVQSVWDTGLRMPANGVLFAVIAAMALHEPRPARSDASRSRPHTRAS